MTKGPGNDSVMRDLTFARKAIHRLESKDFAPPKAD